MINAFFVFCAIVGIGVFSIFRGKSAIKNKFISNSMKSALVTGITHIKGKQAVKMGKVMIGMGYAFIGIGILGMLFTGTLVIVGLVSKSDRSHLVTTTTHTESHRSPSGSSSSTTTITSNRPGSRQTTTTRSSNDRVQKNTRPNNAATREASRRRAADKDNSSSNAFANRFGNSDSAESSGGDTDTGSSTQPDPSPFGNTKSAFPPTSSNDAPVFNGDIGQPSQALPAISFRKTDVIKSDLIGFRITDKDYRDDIELDRVLVGMIVNSTTRGRNAVQNIQPIYQKGNQYIKGKVLGGVGGGETTVLLAPAGYVVSGMSVETSIGIDCLQLSFMRLGADGRLQTDDVKSSESVGRSQVRKKTIFGEGKPVVSVFGAAQRSQLVAIGLVAAKRLSLD